MRPLCLRCSSDTKLCVVYWQCCWYGSGGLGQTLYNLIALYFGLDFPTVSVFFLNVDEANLVSLYLGGINLLFARISDAANSSRRSQQYKQ